MAAQCLFPVATGSSHEWWQKSEPCSSYNLSWYFVSGLSIITVLYNAISHHSYELWENDFVLRSNIMFCFYSALRCTAIWGDCFFLLSGAIICLFPWTKAIQMPFACVINSLAARRNKLGFSGALTEQLKSKLKMQIGALLYEKLLFSVEVCAGFAQKETNLRSSLQF